MPNRISGITGIFDTDALVSTTLQPYKLKITNYEKQKMLLELKQEQYRDVLTKTREFYNKYLTASSSDSLIFANNYKNVSFSSSDNGVVTAKGLSGAQVSNYQVTVNKLAKEAKSRYINDTDVQEGDRITIQGKEFELKGSTLKEIAKNLNTQLVNEGINVRASYTDFVEGSDKSAMVLKSTATGASSSFSYSISNSSSNTEGYVFDNTQTVKIDGLKIDLSGAGAGVENISNYINTKLSENGKSGIKCEVNAEDPSRITFKNVETEVNNGETKALYYGLEKGDKITIKGREYTLTGSTNQAIQDNLNAALLANGETGISVNFAEQDFTANGSAISTTKLSVTNNTGNSIKISKAKSISVTAYDKYDVSTLDTSEDTSDGKQKLTLTCELRSGEKVEIGGKVYTLNGVSNENIIDDLNNQLLRKGVKINASYDGGNLILKSSEASTDEFEAGFIVDVQTETVTHKTFSAQPGETIKISGVEILLEADASDPNKVDINRLKDKINTSSELVDIIDVNSLNYDEVNGKLTIEANNGQSFNYSKVLFSETVTGSNADVVIKNADGIEKNYTGESNTTILDNVEFTFNGVSSEDSNKNKISTSLTASKDTEGLKKKIVSFVNDYNTLIKDLNTKLSEKRYSSYMPLTSDEKKDMSDDDIELWNKKVNQGLIRKDYDVSRIVSQMKNAMRTMISGSGLKLESIGITPVKDYQTSNGTFEIDEDKLDQALENNIEGVKDLFLKESTNNGLYEDGGILTNLKSLFDKEVMTKSSSQLIKKAGLQGSVSDEISKELEKMQDKIDEMNASLTERENNLYTKYASLESTLSSLQSQQSYLASYFN